MAFKLEDLINKKKEPNQILDLSKIKIKSKEDFEKYFDKIPEFKIRPEKVRPEDAKIRDTDFSFIYSKKEAKMKAKHEYQYGDPVPASMRSVRLDDLVAVDISWRMLTMARPKNKLEEDIFNRLVELGKLTLNTRRQEQEHQQATGGGGPGSSGNNPGGTSGVPNNSPQALAQLGIVVTKNKRGVTETKVKSCKECGEEHCTGQWCKEFPYDSYTRMILDKDELEKQEAEEKGVTLRKPSKTKAAAALAKPGAGKGKGKLTLGKKIKGAKAKSTKKKKKAEGVEDDEGGLGGKSEKPKLKTKSGTKGKGKDKNVDETAEGADGGDGHVDGAEPKKKVKRKKKRKKASGNKTDKTSDDSD